MADLDQLMQPRPSVGPDYLSLANATRPQMMGNAPIGGGANAGMLYGQDMNRHDALVAQATQQAGLEATLRAQAADEWQQGSEGRQAVNRTQAALAKGREGMVNDKLDVERGDIELKQGEQKRKKRAGQVMDFEPYSRKWEGANNQQDKDDIIAEMKADKDLNLPDDFDYTHAERLMKRVNDYLENSESAKDKRYAVDAGVQKSEIAANASLAKQALANEAKQMQVKAQILMSQGKLNMSQWEAKQLERMAAGEMTEGEAAAFKVHMEQKLAEATAKAANSPQQIDIVPPKGSPINARPPVKPQAPAIPPQNGPKVSGAIQRPVPTGKTGTMNGKKIQEMSDGSIMDEQGNRYDQEGNPLK